MKIFTAFSYSTKVNYETGEVFPEHKDWVESQITKIEQAGHEVFCALRADGYTISDADPAAAFFLDMDKLEWCDALVAFLGETTSPGLQTEVGYAIAKKKKVVLVKNPDVDVAWFNRAMEESGVLSVVEADFDANSL